MPAQRGPCDRGFLLCRARVTGGTGHHAVGGIARNRVAAPAFSRRRKDDPAEDDSSHPSSRRGPSRFRPSTSV